MLKKHMLTVLMLLDASSTDDAAALPHTLQ